MILWRTLPWDPGAGESEPGGRLWFPRRRQGGGRHDDPAAGLRWWSVLEASWLTVTLFDRAARHLTVEDVQILNVEDSVVREAAAFLGLA